MQTLIKIKDWLELEFLACDKINEVESVGLPMILAITITEHSLTEFLVDDINLCNMLYSGTTGLISIKQIDLNPYDGGDLLAFNDSITHPQGVVDLTVTAREGACERKVILNFLIIHVRAPLEVS